MSRSLHWSVSPIDADDRRFVACVREALAQRAAAPPAATASRYRVLSRWRAFYEWGVLPSDGDVHGHVSLTRQPQPDGWLYAVRLENVMAGEQTELRFATDATPQRALRGEWSVASDYHNDYNTPGALRTYRCAGGRADDGEIRLRLRGGLAFAAGRIPPDRRLVADWALVDAVAHLVGREFAVLDRLECLKPVVRARPVGHWMCALGPEPVALTGYAVWGEGLDPRYWWLDAAGRAVLLSTTQNVWVLES